MDKQRALANLILRSRKPTFFWKASRPIFWKEHPCTSKVQVLAEFKAWSLNLGLRRTHTCLPFPNLRIPRKDARLKAASLD